MNYTIFNDLIEVTVSDVGAELMSIKSRKDGTEYLWQGDPAFWAGRAYNLFPICGRLTEGKYTFRGETYEMNLHGFVRKSTLDATVLARDKIDFGLRSDERTLKMYPFDFEYHICYSLVGSTVKMEISVVNHTESTMPFALGGHPGFNVPLGGGKFEDWYLEFCPECAPVQVVFSDACLTTDERAEFPLEDGRRLRLRHDLFDRDAASGTDRRGERRKFVRLRKDQCGIPPRQPFPLRIQVHSVGVAESDHREPVAVLPLLLVAGDLKVVGTPLSGIKTADQLEGIEFPPLQHLAGHRLGNHILFRLPVGMAEDRDAAARPDPVECPLRSRHRKRIKPGRDLPKAGRDLRNLPPILRLVPAGEFVHALRASEVDDVHRIIRRMNLFARIKFQTGRKLAPHLDRTERRRVAAVVGHRDEVHAELAAAGGDVLRRLPAVGVLRMHVEIPAEHLQSQQVGTDRIEVETVALPAAQTVGVPHARIGQNDREVVLLFSGKPPPDQQRRFRR